MPAKSKAQANLMQAVAHGWKGGPKSLSKAEAKKFMSDTKTPYKKLPARKSK